jgi:hypothetical protein
MKKINVVERNASSVFIRRMNRSYWDGTHSLPSFLVISSNKQPQQKIRPATMRIPFPLNSFHKFPAVNEDDDEEDNDTAAASTEGGSPIAALSNPLLNNDNRRRSPDGVVVPAHEEGDAPATTANADTTSTTTSLDQNDPSSARQKQQSPPPTVLPLSMQLMRRVTGGRGLNCPNCDPPRQQQQSSSIGMTTTNQRVVEQEEEETEETIQKHIMMEQENQEIIQSTAELFWCQPVDANDAVVHPIAAAQAQPTPPKQHHIVSPAVYHPMLTIPQAVHHQQHHIAMEQIVAEYRTACEFYRRDLNSGVLTTLRFHVPYLRVAPDFGDVDMLALAEILIRYSGNGLPLSYIRRLDFSKRKLRGHVGFGSHGALTLAKIIQAAPNITEVFLERNVIGPYGAAAIFVAVGHHPHLHTIRMRRCRILEPGARAFAHYCLGNVVVGRPASSPSSALRNADLSANYIGYSVRIKCVVCFDPAMTGICQLIGNLVFLSSTRVAWPLKRP